MTNPLIRSIPLEKIPRKLSRNYILWEFVTNTLPFIAQNVVLAGGTCRNLIKRDEINDFDLFFIGNEETRDSNFLLAKDSFKDNPRYYKIFECKEGKLITYRDKLSNIKIQLIKEDIYETVEVLLNRFDFNATRFAIYERKFYYSRQSIKDVKTKILSLFNLIFPVSTIKRAYKYQNKGYQINDCLTSIVRHINAPESQFTDDELKRAYID